MTESKWMREHIQIKVVLSYGTSKNEDKDKSNMLYFLLWDLEFENTVPYKDDDVHLIPHHCCFQGLGLGIRGLFYR